MSRQYIPSYPGTLTEDQMRSLAIALHDSLKSYAAQGFEIATVPANSHIGTLRDLSESVDAIRLGNRRGGHGPFVDIKMVPASPEPAPCS